MAGHELLLPIAILAVALAVLVLVLRLRADLRTTAGVDTDTLSAAIERSWRELGVGETVGAIETHANEMKSFHDDIATLLRSPRERGEFGELQLDVILADHLPPEMYGIREQIGDGIIPDAHVRSSSGLVPIDAKFPLDNYEAFVHADDEEAAERHRRNFRTDVDRQLEKIATEYVRPGAGTTDFAFAFIPSESVYYHLVREEHDLLREYTTRGVQVVSPLTLGHKLELISADVQAAQLSDEAAAVRDRLAELADEFESVADEWDTLHRHIRNAESKADDVDREFDRLRTAFDRIDRPTIDD